MRLILGAFLSIASFSGGVAPLATYETPFYVIETDVPKERAAYIGRLMDATGKEYHRRFQGFRGVVRSKPRVKVFARREDFEEAFDRGSDAEQLAKHARGLFHHSDQTVYTFDGPGVESTLKHECFHQFVKLVVGGRLPSWANEGLAEYFAEGEFDETSGRLQLGSVPGWRVRALRQAATAHRLIPVADLIRLAPREWNDRLANGSGSLSYLQAWVLCHFLIHAEEGKYRVFLDRFLRHLDHGVDPETAFQRSFGDEFTPLQAKYSAYIESLEPRGPIAD